MDWRRERCSLEGVEMSSGDRRVVLPRRELFSDMRAWFSCSTSSPNSSRSAARGMLLGGKRTRGEIAYPYRKRKAAGREALLSGLRTFKIIPNIQIKQSDMPCHTKEVSSSAKTHRISHSHH